MKMRPTVLLLALGSLISALPASAGQPRRSDKPVTVLVDGKRMPMSPPAMIRQGRVFIPVTAFRGIGLAVKLSSRRKAWVAWPDSDNIRQFKAGVRTYTEPRPVGQAVITLPGTPFLHRGTLMVPLRAHLSSKRNQTGLVATWNPKSRVVHVHRPRGFLRWRLEDDAALVRERPDWYSHVWLGNYIPIVPKHEIARAKELDGSGDWQRAVRILRRLINSKPFTWQPETRHVEDEWLAYEPLGKILTRANPQEGEGYLCMGIGRALVKDYPGAQEAFRRGLEAEPSADLQFAAGWAILRQERLQTVFHHRPETLRSAIACFEKALETNPRHELSLRAAGYASLHVAYLEAQAGGYTEESKAQSRPYMEKAGEYFERLRRQTQSGLWIDKLLKTIHQQLGES